MPNQMGWKRRESSLWVIRPFQEAPDFDQETLTTDGEIYPLDLSAIVPATAKAVWLGLNIFTDTPLDYLSMYNSLDLFGSHGACVEQETVGGMIYGQFVVPCPESRVFEYAALIATSGVLNICVLGWII